jgi:hypothetical protein
MKLALTCFLLKRQQHQANSLLSQLLLSSHDTEFFSLAETLEQQLIGSSFSTSRWWTTWIVTIGWFASSFISLGQLRMFCNVNNGLVHLNKITSQIYDISNMTLFVLQQQKSIKIVSLPLHFS